MPTHRDHPWERDLAAALGRSPARRSWRTPILLALVIAGVLGALLLRTDGVGRAPSAAPAAAPGADVTRVRSRFLDRRTLEVWGRTTAPDGATVRLRIRAGRRAGAGRRAPAADGHFYARVRLPAALRGRALRVSATVGDEGAGERRW